MLDESIEVKYVSHDSFKLTFLASEIPGAESSVLILRSSHLKKPGLFNNLPVSLEILILGHEGLLEASAMPLTFLTFLHMFYSPLATPQPVVSEPFASFLWASFLGHLTTQPCVPSSDLRGPAGGLSLFSP